MELDAEIRLGAKEKSTHLAEVVRAFLVRVTELCGAAFSAEESILFYSILFYYIMFYSMTVGWKAGWLNPSGFSEAQRAAAVEREGFKRRGG